MKPREKRPTIHDMKIDDKEKVMIQFVFRKKRGTFYWGNEKRLMLWDTKEYKEQNITKNNKNKNLIQLFLT